MKTYSAKPTDVARKWYIIDATEAPLGRVATRAAKLLIGKDKPMFTHNIDCGDYVVIINASNLVVTGKKMEQKMYHRHSGHPGALKSLSLSEQLSKDPTKVVIHAIRGMLPVNKLRDERLRRLKVYPDDQHKQTAQQPESIKVTERR